MPDSVLASSRSVPRSLGAPGGVARVPAAPGIASVKGRARASTTSRSTRDRSRGTRQVRPVARRRAPVPRPLRPARPGTRSPPRVPLRHHDLPGVRVSGELNADLLPSWHGVEGEGDARAPSAAHIPQRCEKGRTLYRCSRNSGFRKSRGCYAYSAIREAKRWSMRMEEARRWSPLSVSGSRS